MAQQVTPPYVQQDKLKFLQFLTVGAVTHGTTTSTFTDASGTSTTMESLRARFGDNFNTFVVLNLGSVNFDVILDGNTVATVNKANGSFSFDWKDGIIYNHLEFKNIDAATDSTSGDLRITVGRSGM